MIFFVRKIYYDFFLILTFNDEFSRGLDRSGGSRRATSECARVFFVGRGYQQNGVVTFVDHLEQNIEHQKILVKNCS